RNVFIEAATGDKEQLKRQLALHMVEASGRPLSEAERKDHAATAMLWLKRMATNEVTGYDIRPAAGAILKGLNNPELAPLAIKAAGRLRGRLAQQALAAVVISAPRTEIQ